MWLIIHKLKACWDDKKIFKQLPSFMMGVLGAIFLLLCVNFIKSPSKPRIGTVNITALVDNFVKTQTREKLTPLEQDTRVRDFGETLEKTLKQISHDYQVVLMPSEAVIAGSQDFTPLCEERLRQAAKK